LVPRFRLRAFRNAEGFHGCVRQAAEGSVDETTVEESGTSPGNRLGGRIEVMAATRQSPVT